MTHICNSPIWDSNLTWVTTNPFFTPCFENVVVATLPFVFIVISTLLNIFDSPMFEKLQNTEEMSTKRGFRTLTFLTVLKGFTTVSLIGIHGVQLVNTGIRDEYTEVAQSFLSPAVQMAGYIGALTLFVVNFRSNIFNSGVEFGFWLIGTLTQAVLFRTAVHVIGGAPMNCVHQIPRLITFRLVFFRLIVELLTSRKTAVRRSSDEGVKVHSLANPDKTSPFLSRILFTWYDKLSLAGYRRTLTSEDFWGLNLKDISTVQFESLAGKWNRTKDGTLSNVLIPIVKSFGWRYCLAVVMIVGGCGLLLFEPFIVSRLITHVTSDEEESWKGYFYMAVIVTTVSAQAVLTINWDKITQIICMKVKAVLSAAVYRKSLLISHAAKAGKDMSVGVMLNLISVDVHKCMEFLIAHHATSDPLIISICTFILYDTLGVAAFIGIGMFGVLMLISNLLTICLGAKYQRQGMQLRDQRIRITSEVLSGIKVLKFYGWEIPFENKIKEVRKEELRCVWKLSWILSLASSICTASPILVAMMTFSWYLLSNPDHNLTPTEAFVLVNIMNILRGYMVVLPSAVISLSQIYVSMKRLNQFFQLEELEAVQGNEIPNSDGKYPVVIDKGSFSWTSDGNPTLKEVTLQIKDGELTGIVGEIGSGKSSLLSAILGEMKMTSGKIDSIADSVAYVGEIPWIQNASLRDNILCGSPYDSDKYNPLIYACALIEIRDRLGGDLVEIEGSDIKLTEGEMQRVALARAAYKDAALYLFDDPLSAVDESVGEFIFEALVGRNGILRSKACFFVTNDTKLLADADKILVLKGGKITECGSYQELLQTQVIEVNEGDDPQFHPNRAGSPQPTGSAWKQVERKESDLLHARRRNRTASLPGTSSMAALETPPRVPLRMAHPEEPLGPIEPTSPVVACEHDPGSPAPVDPIPEGAPAPTNPPPVVDLAPILNAAPAGNAPLAPRARGGGRRNAMSLEESRVLFILMLKGTDPFSSNRLFRYAQNEWRGECITAGLANVLQRSDETLRAHARSTLRDRFQETPEIFEYDIPEGHSAESIRLRERRTNLELYLRR